MTRGGNPCLGCGCKMSYTINYSYCSLCRDNKCANCGALGVKSDLCLRCRENR